MGNHNFFKQPYLLLHALCGLVIYSFEQAYIKQILLKAEAK